MQRGNGTVLGARLPGGTRARRRLLRLPRCRLCGNGIRWRWFNAGGEAALAHRDVGHAPWAHRFALGAGGFEDAGRCDFGGSGTASLCGRCSRIDRRHEPGQPTEALLRLNENFAPCGGDRLRIARVLPRIGGSGVPDMPRRLRARHRGSSRRAGTGGNRDAAHRQGAGIRLRRACATIDELETSMAQVLHTQRREPLRRRALEDWRGPVATYPACRQGGSDCECGRSGRHFPSARTAPAGSSLRRSAGSEQNNNSVAQDHRRRRPTGRCRRPSSTEHTGAEEPSRYNHRCSARKPTPAPNRSRAPSTNPDRRDPPSGHNGTGCRPTVPVVPRSAQRQCKTIPRWYTAASPGRGPHAVARRPRTHRSRATRRAAPIHRRTARRKPCPPTSARVRSALARSRPPSEPVPPAPAARSPAGCHSPPRSPPGCAAIRLIRFGSRFITRHASLSGGRVRERHHWQCRSKVVPSPRARDHYANHQKGMHFHGCRFDGSPVAPIQSAVWMPRSIRLIEL